jgi:bleomycin hydrolase
MKRFRVEYDSDEETLPDRKRQRIDNENNENDNNNEEEISDQLLRTLYNTDNNVEGQLSIKQIERFKNKFKSDHIANVVKNAITSVGILNATMDVNKHNENKHLFINSVKPMDLKATNQHQTGRCWMFAALNVFRHLIIKAIDIEDFEFSQTYLFFWDKFERSNYMLQYFIDNNDSPTEREPQCLMEVSLSDGGYWTFFANLVHKYGLVPKSVMQETAQSYYSPELNDTLQEYILAGCNTIYEKKQKGVSNKELTRIKDELMEQVFSILTKSFGNMPETFSWYFRNDRKETHAMHKLTPQIYAQTLLGGIDIRDFVVLANIPSKTRPYNKTYTIKNMSNVVGGNKETFMNMDIRSLKKYAQKCLKDNVGVWFAGDVGKGFNPYEFTLDETTIRTEDIFGKVLPFTKEQKVLFGNTSASHAMVLTGFNEEKEGKPTQWQVENSWGYYDHLTPGLDGFLSMSDKWFDDNLMEIVIHKSYLSRTDQKLLTQTPIELNMWDFMAPALRVDSSHMNPNANK